MLPYDRHDLYECCVQEPEAQVAFLQALMPEAQRLGEDYAGGAAVSRAWVAAVSGGTAVAVDIDGPALARAAGEGVEIVVGDVIGATQELRHGIDLLFVGNFSIGYHHDRASLLRYLAHARARLPVGGVLACELYGGTSAYTVGSDTRLELGPFGRVIEYTWEQRQANPLTGRVLDVLHFRVLHGEHEEANFRDAFMYDLRLWSIAELRDAMIEVGFAKTEVHDRTDPEGRVLGVPVTDPKQLPESYLVAVVARA